MGIFPTKRRAEQAPRDRVVVRPIGSPARSRRGNRSARMARRRAPAPSGPERARNNAVESVQAGPSALALAPSAPPDKPASPQGAAETHRNADRSEAR